MLTLSAARRLFPAPDQGSPLGKASRKYYRTIVLGVAALAALVWSAVDQFGIPWEAMLDLLLLTVAVIGATILSAAMGAGLWIGLRKLMRRRE